MSDKSPIPTQEFFRSWQLYQDVIEHNYMAHREIIACLRKFSESKDLSGSAILDLGCGDAYTVRTAWGNLDQVQFTGVDLSAPALQFAQDALVDSNWFVRLIEGDLSAVLQELNDPFDLIMAGHSLHHLQNPAKQRALVRMRELLKPQGKVLIYDLLPREQESRDVYVQRLLHDNERDWNLLSEDQLVSIRSHVENFDFPIELADWEAYATQAGFANCELRYRDEKDHYGLLVLSP